MRILTNPNRDKEEIDESEENMFYRFQKSIEEDIAEQKRLGQELSKERERPTIGARNNLGGNEQDPSALNEITPCHTRKGQTGQKP